MAADSKPETTSVAKDTPNLASLQNAETESSAADDEENEDEDEEAPLGTWEATPSNANAVSQPRLPPDTPTPTPTKTAGKSQQSIAPALPHHGIDDPDPPTQESDYMTQEVPRPVQTQGLNNRNTPSKRIASTRSELGPMEGTPRSHLSGSTRMGDAVNISPRSQRSELSGEQVVVAVDDTADVGNNTIIPFTQHLPAELLTASGENGLDSKAIANSSSAPKRKSSGLEADDNPEDEQRYQKRARSIQPSFNEPQDVPPSPAPDLNAPGMNEKFLTPMATPVRHQSRSLEQRLTSGSSSPSLAKSIRSDRALEISKHADVRRSLPASLSRDAVMRAYTAHEVYEEFKSEYTEYSGSMDHFGNMCRRLRDPLKLRVPQMAWDDFICRHLEEYRPYADECVMNGERPMDYEDYYDEFATNISHPLKVMKAVMLATVIRELEKTDR